GERVGNPLHEREVLTPDLAPAKRLGEGGVGLLRAGEDEQSRSLAVEAVHDSSPFTRTRPPSIRCAADVREPTSGRAAISASRRTPSSPASTVSSIGIGRVPS